MDRATQRARNDAIRASTDSAHALAARHGLTYGAVCRIRAAAPGPRVLTRKERFQLEVVEGGWRAACMDDDEWSLWVAHNPITSITDGLIADRPCRDCPVGFAADMRAEGRCNGTPGEAVP